MKDRIIEVFGEIAELERIGEYQVFADQIDQGYLALASGSEGIEYLKIDNTIARRRLLAGIPNDATQSRSVEASFTTENYRLSFSASFLGESPLRSEILYAHILGHRDIRGTQLATVTTIPKAAFEETAKLNVPFDLEFIDPIFLQRTSSTYGRGAVFNLTLLFAKGKTRLIYPNPEDELLGQATADLILGVPFTPPNMDMTYLVREVSKPIYSFSKSDQDGLIWEVFFPMVSIQTLANAISGRGRELINAKNQLPILVTGRGIPLLSPSE